MPTREFRFLPLTVRIETVGGVATPLVLRGTPLPATRSEVFSTARDNQSAVEVSLWLGERPLKIDNLKIGSFEIKNLPAGKAGGPQIKVEFTVDKTCKILARAKVQGSDLSAEKWFKPPVDLTQKTVEEIIADAQREQEGDEARLRKVEASNRANGLIKKAEEQLKTGSNAKLSASIAELGLALAADDVTAIREKTDALELLLSTTIDSLSSEIFKSYFTSQVPKKAVSPLFSTTTAKESASKKKQDVTVTPHFQQLGKIFGGAKFTLDPQLCFVLMPFDERFRPLYDNQIRPAVERAGLRCERADDIHGAGLITWDIWERINRARFLIAELTDKNPNVFYEVGLAHALSKDVILMTQSKDFVPFDLKGIRYICYEYPDGVDKLAKALNATITALIKSG